MSNYCYWEKRSGTARGCACRICMFSHLHSWPKIHAYHRSIEPSCVPALYCQTPRTHCGTLPNTRLISSMVTAFHYLKVATLTVTMVVGRGLCLLSRVLSRCQMFSMGLRSGEDGGHTCWGMWCSSSYAFVAPESGQ